MRHTTTALRSAAALLLLLPGVAAAAPPAAPVRVVATLPIYADIARQIGGDQVEVTAIASPHEDAHFVRPRPSFAARLRDADLFITTGLDLEIWAPPLLDRAGNRRVAEGGDGYVSAHDGIALRDVPRRADRSEGDIHIYGNPHIYTDPLNAVQVARNVAAGLKRVAPDRAARWDRGLAAFADRVYRRLYGDRLVELLGGPTLERLSQQGQLDRFLSSQQYEGQPLGSQLGGWLRDARAFRGTELICYHKDFEYFENRFGVDCVEYVEAKPGIPPTPGHVGSLIRLMRDQGIGTVVAATYYGEQRARTVADRAGARVVMLPMEPGDVEGVDDYFDMVDYWVEHLAAATR